MATPLPAPAPALPAALKDIADARVLAEEIRVGLDRMRHMSHDELRELVQSRIRMLDSVMTEREQKKAAMETARLASGVLEIRRERAHTIRRRVDAWSAAAAVVCFGYVMAHIGL